MVKQRERESEREEREEKNWGTMLNAIKNLR